MDPTSIMGVGSLLQGAGSVLGGLFGGSKKPAEMPISEQYHHYREHTQAERYREAADKMEIARLHGLHPLTVMGVNMASGMPMISPPSGGGSSGPDFSAIGYGAGQVAKGLVKPPEPEVDPLERRAAEANVRLLEAQAKRAEWEALGTEWKVADYAAPRLIQGQPGNPPAARVSNDVVEMQRLAAEQSGLSPGLFANATAPIKLEQTVLPPHPRNLGHAAGTDQAFVTVMGSDGKPGSMLNQNVIQAEYQDGATMNWLVKTFGIERANAIMAALEQAGIFGSLGVAATAAGKLWYDSMAKQRAEALKRRMNPRIIVDKPKPYRPGWRKGGGE